ncbi:MAG TPA: class I SAM-dependent methyltransferase [Steroidobacteraceae bacterium]|jgi:SAM-dependent methyltransferase
MHTESAARRLQPRITNSDWLVLRGMRPAIERMAAQAGRTSATAVDLGCGSQPYRPIFDARGITYRGADLENADIRIDENGRVDLADGSADLVLSFQVLEHVRDVRQYLAEALRIVRKDGWLLLSTHGTWLYHPHPEDHHRWTRQGLLAELAASGFETTECVAVVGPLGWTTMVRLTCWYQACRRIPLIGRPLAGLVALVMNARGYVEELITPEWVRRDNACVYVTLSRVNSRSSSSGRMNFS